VIVNAAMIYLAAQVVPGITLRGKPLWPALLAGLVLALINAVVRPVLKIVTLPLTLLTLGLFLFVLNAFCLWLTSAIVPGFDVESFWAAFLGALLLSVVSWALTVFVSDSGRLGRL
jgi:putative membrane protein